MRPELLLVPTPRVELGTPGLQPVRLPQARWRVGDDRGYLPPYGYSPGNRRFPQPSEPGALVTSPNGAGRGEDRNVEDTGIEPVTSACKTEVIPFN